MRLEPGAQGGFIVGSWGCTRRAFWAIGLRLSAWRDGRPQKVLSRVNTCCDLGPPWCLESSPQGPRVAAGDPLGGYFGIQVREEGSSQGGEMWSVPDRL